MKKKLRVKKNEEFSQIISARHFFKSDGFVLYYQDRKKAYCRIGISVSKKTGTAVLRNKIKRQVRSMCQKIHEQNDSHDYIVMVRPAYLSRNFAENQKDLESLVKKCRILHVSR